VHEKKQESEDISKISEKSLIHGMIKVLQQLYKYPVKTVA